MSGTNGNDPALEVRNLTVAVPSRTDTATVVRDASLVVGRGEIVALVGESGCGKTMTARAIMRLLPPTAYVSSGEVLLAGKNLMALSDNEMRQIRLSDLAIVFQHAHTSLNPLMTIGDQIAEGLRVHLAMSGKAARLRAIELLHRVGIPDAKARVDDYPFRFSGGMKQRVMIAMALSCGPSLLIADEPTTALDVSVQAQIMELLMGLRDSMGLSQLFITHDLGVVSGLADRVYTMYAGRVVESGEVNAVFARPAHPYTDLLVNASPRLGNQGSWKLPVGGPPATDSNIPDRGCPFRPRCAYSLEVCGLEMPPMREPAPARLTACWAPLIPTEVRSETRPSAQTRLDGAADDEVAVNGPDEILDDLFDTSTPLRVNGLKVHFPLDDGIRITRERRYARAVDDVSLAIREGEILGLVGESGSGKTSLARAILRLCPITSGTIQLLGRDITRLRGRDLRPMRRHIQVVLQDPYDSLNPHMSVREIISEPLKAHKLNIGADDRLSRVMSLLDLVGLDASNIERKPGHLSGGERQRVSIARAIAPEPRVLICDEPTSALDVSVQAQILDLLKRLRDEMRLSILFISHDLAVVQNLADRIMVMYNGVVVEQGPTQALFAQPKHPYTKALLSAIPEPDLSMERTRHRKRILLDGEAPSPISPPAGCRFHPRCPFSRDRCIEVEPALETVGRDEVVACHFWRQIEASVHV